MNLTKRVTTWFLTLVMVLGLIPQTVFAEETDASSFQTSSPQYEVLQEVNEDKTEATISLEFTETETIQLEKVTLPDGTEKVEDLSSVTYVVTENGNYDFKVNYSLEGTPKEETIPVEVSRLEEKGNITSNENNEDPKQKTDSKNSNEVSPKNVKHIHLNSHDGNDQNDGLTEESSVKTFAKAKSLIQDGDIILLDSYVEVTNDETWTLSEFPNSKLQRNAGGDMIVVNPKATLTLQNIVIDGTTYTFNGSSLGGKNLVTFEELYDLSNPDEPIKVAEHKDIEDDGQTVLITNRIINIHTTATDKDGKKEIEAAKEVTIIDKVTLEGLEVGTKYKLVGWQMLKENNAELLIDGKKVENEYEFIADKENMEVEIAYTFNATALCILKKVRQCRTFLLYLLIQKILRYLINLQRMQIYF